MNRSKINGQIAIVLLLIIIPVLFISLTVFAKPNSSIMLNLVYIMILIAQIYFTSDVVGLLYKFYEMKKPWQRFIPVINEFYLLDIKYRRFAWITFFLSVILMLLANLPYQIKAIFGRQFMTTGSFYLFFIAFVIFLICQIIVGIGVMNSAKDISEEWERLSGCSLGMIGLYKLFSLIPVVRVFAFYGLRKPLDTLVTFNSKTVSSENNVRIEEEKEEDDE